MTCVMEVKKAKALEIPEQTESQLIGGKDIELAVVDFNRLGSSVKKGEVATSRSSRRSRTPTAEDWI